MEPVLGGRIQIPIFPLPATVLFPGALLPLHIFEPRYRAMARAALAGDRRIAMVLLREGSKKNYEGTPPIHSIACAGLIIADHRLDDGRYNLLLRGTARIRIEREQMLGAYRMADAMVLGEDPGNARVVQREVHTLLACSRQLALTNADLMRTLPKLEELAAEPGALVDGLANAFVTDPQERQELLETLDVEGRIEKLTEAIAALVLAADKRDAPKRGVDDPTALN